MRVVWELKGGWNDRHFMTTEWLQILLPVLEMRPAPAASVKWTRPQTKCSAFFVKSSKNSAASV